LEGLGASGDPAAFDTILRWTANDRPTRARAAASAALARLADEVETLRRRAAERLVELAEDPNYRVQVAAIVALGTVREALAIPVLSRIHAAAGDARCRRLAWESLQAVREGRTTEGGLSALRKEVEGLVEENRKLRDRVGRLEGPR
jgi:HEAT repeat protein